MKHVKIMRGIAGAGKSHFVGREFPSAVVCSANDYFVRNGIYRFDVVDLSAAHENCWWRFSEAMRLKEELIVIDNTNTKFMEVTPYLLPALVFGYEVEVVTIVCEVNVAFMRNIHSVPMHTVRRQAKNLEREEPYIPSHWNHRMVPFVRAA